MHSSMIARLDSDTSESDEIEDRKKEHRPTVRRVQTARETRTRRSDSEESLEQFTKRFAYLHNFFRSFWAFDQTVPVDKWSIVA